MLTASATATVIDDSSFAVMVGVLESAAVTVKFDVPPAVGDPVMSPLPLSSESPAGSDPLVTAQETGAVPPLDARVTPTYGLPACPPGSDAVVMFAAAGDRNRYGGSGGLGRAARVGGANREEGDRARTGGCAGDVPVLLLRLRPFGREPEVTDQVTGALPPEEASVTPRRGSHLTAGQ